MKVGDVVYIRDENRRQYAPGPPGPNFLSGPPLEEGHWTEEKVTAVGRKWVTAGHGKGRQFDIHTGHSKDGVSAQAFYSLRDKEDFLFAKKTRPDAVEFLRYEASADVIRLVLECKAMPHLAENLLDELCRPKKETP